jgi:hypothetical protein
MLWNGSRVRSCPISSLTETIRSLLTPSDVTPNLKDHRHIAGANRRASPAAGIGTDANGRRSHIQFINGTYDISSTRGAGIGAGAALNGRQSRVAQIAIGAADAIDGRSAVGAIVLHNGTLSTITVSIGAGIGSRHCDNSESVVTPVGISNGVFNLTRDCGAGIGSDSGNFTAMAGVQ